MDVWIFAAAAGAGIFAKYARNYPRGRKMPVLEVSPGGSNAKEIKSPMLVYKPESKDVPFPTQREESDRREIIEGGESVSDANCGEVLSYDVFPMGVSCNCGILDVKVQNSGSRVDEELCRGNLQENENETTDTNGVVHFPGYHVSVNSRREIGKSSRNRKTLRCKQPCLPLAKPFGSLESCLVAQLCLEQTKVNTLVSSIPSASVATARPMIMANENQMISLPNEEVMQLGEGEDDFFYSGPCEKDEIVLEIPPLPRIDPSDLSKKVKLKLGKGQHGRLNNFRSENSQNHAHRKETSLISDAIHAFGLGVCAGAISSAMAHKKEVDRVKELLKQTENLVEDLQEELEMKDMLTVKDLADEFCESQYIQGDPFRDKTPDVLPSKIGNEGPCEHGIENQSQTRSKIEEELEAELERLEFSMNSSSLETRVSNLAEVDPEFVADFVSGKVRAVVKGHVPLDSNHSTPKAYSANYVVSPRELSLRLHEVIQSRLEQHVKELEAAVQNRKVHLADSECMKETSDRAVARTYPKEQPVVVNLSEDAFNAYGKTYEELMKIEWSDEECSVLSFCQKDLQDSLLAYPKSQKEETPTPCELKEPEHQVSNFHRLACEEMNDDSDNDSDTEMEKILIQQVVEKTRNGSPLVWNAQKLLYSV